MLARNQELLTAIAAGNYEKYAVSWRARGEHLYRERLATDQQTSAHTANEGCRHGVPKAWGAHICGSALLLHSYACCGLHCGCQFAATDMPESLLCVVLLLQMLLTWLHLTGWLQTMCDPSMTCFEPEAVSIGGGGGHGRRLVDGNSGNMG